jgi:hypothetical protein
VTSTAEILECCLRKPRETWKKADQMAVADCIKRAGWIANREGNTRLYFSPLAGIPEDE